MEIIAGNVQYKVCSNTAFKKEKCNLKVHIVFSSSLFCYAHTVIFFLLLPVCLFSAVLYLNDDFDGGEFFFADRDAKKVTVRLNFPYSLNVFLSFRSMFIHFS